MLPFRLFYNAMYIYMYSSLCKDFSKTNQNKKYFLYTMDTINIYILYIYYTGLQYTLLSLPWQ